MPIVALRLTHLGPFEDIAFAFDEHINVLVGPNNSGKSTALMALGSLTACPFELPNKLRRPVPAECTVQFVGRHGNVRELRGGLPFMPEDEADLEAWASMLSELGYTAFVPALRQSIGFHVPGLQASRSGRRPLGGGQQTTGPLTEGVSQALPDELRRRQTLWPTNASLLRDDVAVESLVELDTQAYRWNDPSLAGIIAQVATVASDIVEGFPMQFLRVAEDQDGLFPLFRTPDGDVPLHVLSQGTQSVMQWMTYVLAGYAKYYGYPTNLAEQPGVVLIDEIDAHLHPAAQRRVLPALQRHFPRLQIFCSTHSPLMLSGLKTRQIQLLSRDSHGKLTLSRNDTDIVGWSSDEILRGLLGVAHPTDLETERQLGRLYDLQRRPALSPAEATELEQLRRRLSQTFLGGSLSSPAQPPPAPDQPSAPVAAPKAKTARPARPKRAAGKTAASATRRRSAKAK